MTTQEQIKDIQDRLESLKGYLEIDAKRTEVEEEDVRTQDPDFWNKPKEAEALLKKLKQKRRFVL